MKALVYCGPKQVEVRNVAEPAPRPASAKVRMRYCGICGSDIGIYAGKHPRAKAPLILGHEFVGVVETVLEGSHFRAGDRVATFPLITCGSCLPCRTGTPHVCKSLKLIGIDCDGGIAQHAWIEEDKLVKLGDALSDKAAALIEPLAVIVRTLHQAKFALRDSAVVTGAGPIGLLTAIVLRDAGAARIIISDIDEARLAICRSFGFETVDSGKQSLIEYVNSVTGGDGVDVVFECSGAESAALEMTKLARVGGTICMTGVHKAPHPVNLMDLNFKEQTLIGSRVYTKREFEMTVNYAEGIAAELEKVVTHIVPLSEAGTVFDLIADPSEATMKVLVDCTK